MSGWLGKELFNWILKSGSGKRGPNLSSYLALAVKFSTTKGSLCKFGSQWSSSDELSLSMSLTRSNKCGARRGRSATLISGTDASGGELPQNSCHTDLMCCSLLQATMMHIKDKHACTRRP